MELEVGKSYVLDNGVRTGPLVGTTRSQNYPLYSKKLCCYFRCDGFGLGEYEPCSVVHEDALPALKEAAKCLCPLDEYESFIPEELLKLLGNMSEEASLVLLLFAYHEFRQSLSISDRQNYPDLQMELCNET